MKRLGGQSPVTAIDKLPVFAVLHAWDLYGPMASFQSGVLVIIAVINVKRVKVEAASIL